MSFLLIYITHKNESEATKIANLLVKEKLVACANCFPIQSVYWWQGAVQKEGEWVSIVKTSTRLWDAVREHVEAVHSYEVPCIMKMVVEANLAYEQWIEESVIS